MTVFYINTISKLFYARQYKKASNINTGAPETSQNKVFAPVKWVYSRGTKIWIKFKEFILGLFGYFNEDTISVDPTF